MGRQSLNKLSCLNSKAYKRNQAEGQNDTIMEQLPKKR